MPRVAITGMGALSGYGRGVDALWQGLRSGGSAVQPHQAYLGRRVWQSYPMAALPVDMSSLAARLPRQEFLADHHLDEDPDFLAIADCVDQALHDAGLNPEASGQDGDQRQEIGAIVTHESPGLAAHVQGFFRWRRTARAWWRSRSKFDPQSFLYEQQSGNVYRLHSFLYIHYLSALFHLHGFSLYNNNACASGIFAMAVAADRIRNGDVRAMVVVGGDVPQDGTKYRWFKDLGLYSPSGSCRPFQAERDGMVLGSGAAALVLENFDQAIQDGKRIHGEWLGGGYRSEGWKVTFPDVTGQHYGMAMSSALRAAGIRPEDVGLIVPHGVGSGLYDRFEAISLAKVFADGGRAWPPLMPLKGAVGHTLGGCALLETIPAILAMQHREIPEAARCLHPDPILRLGTPHRDSVPDDGVILKCTNGFAGQNGAMVIRAFRPGSL